MRRRSSSFVFVHGLNPHGRNDHPFETWTAPNKVFWPGDLLPEDIPYARIFVYGYNSMITDAQAMSNASIKDHANTLLNLLDMERSPHMHLGGLIVKQALLNAKEDPKYTSIRTATSGLVFFATPHRGSKSVELGTIAASIARFVSDGSASNDLLHSLEYNSIFTRNMSERFRHQLEDYRVISFIEGKRSQSGLIVDEESAVLGLSGLRETQLKLDADHTKMCKIANRGGAMYHLIKGNIKQLVDQALLTEHGYVPQPGPRPSGQPPPVPPRMHSNPYSPPGASQPSKTKIAGTVYVAQDNDPRSIRCAEMKNKWRWDDARDIDYEMFQERLRTLGPDHASTLQVGYSLAETELEADYLGKALEWCQWVSENAQYTLGPKHILSLRTESLRGEILMQYGKCEEAESICAKILASQQINIGEDHLHTLETRRRLALAYNGLGRREHAVATAESLAENYKRLLGDNHILVFAAILDALDWLMSNPTDSYVSMHLQPDVQQAVDMLPQVHQELQEGLGRQHPLTIRALTLVGRGLTRANQIIKASETLRRALAISEETLGPEHPMSLAIVSNIGLMYALREPQLLAVSSRAEAYPWLNRYLDWLERRRGVQNAEVRCVLKMMADLHFIAKEYGPAQKFYERALAAYGNTDANISQQISTNLQLCRANNMFTNRAGVGSGLSELLSSFKRF
ncbi:hypothetical protein N7468_009634 [Penicillium chermesinum]|uniref:TPR-like protein n=1 Tax=Penicillium chermesinum TaxID=63820 RepID=A0A9W9TGB3_9EURO|nr:uncharacterized protein N7468_009634 [Penicillium chermesinum]KAJ5220430.1 hypothetical protein N7468_009634 [Penicillium chermesinum]KAJ6157869.1 hypothetical protein N7470_005461 [Penicillium chermesinum]